MQQHKESKLHISKANAPFQAASEPRRYVTKLCDEVYQHDSGFCLDLRNSLDLTYRIVLIKSVFVCL